MNKWASSSAVYDHVCSELNTVEQLMVLVAESIKYLEQRNLNDSVINAQFVRVSDNKSDRLRALRELRTTAYGKTVVLDGVKGVKIYHIAQANEGFTNILVLNRMAPVSRILVSAEVGDEIEIPAGIFEVVAVAHLDRYTGLELSVNMDNFRSMELFTDFTISSKTVYDLKKYVGRCKYERLEKSVCQQPKVFVPPVEHQVNVLNNFMVTQLVKEQKISTNKINKSLIVVKEEPPVKKKKKTAMKIKAKSMDSHEAELSPSVVADEEKNTDLNSGLRTVLQNEFSDVTENDLDQEVIDLDEEIIEVLEGNRNQIPLTENSISSLSSGFYTKTTRAQEDLIHQLYGGLVLVEGVAGSGKTSVAMGRSKMLHDQRFSRNEEEIDDFFDLSTMVGFVLSSQLIEYLKITKDQLMLFEMPVKEYHELRESLRRLRRLDPDSKYTRFIGSEQPGKLVGEMPWLIAADRSISMLISNKLSATFTEVPAWMISGDDKKSIVDALWRRVVIQVDNLCQNLKAGSSHFRIEGLAKRIQSIRHFATQVFDERSYWFKNDMELLTSDWLEVSSPTLGINFFLKHGYQLGIYQNDKYWALQDVERQLDLLEIHVGILATKDKRGVVKIGLSGLGRDELKNLLMADEIFHKKKEKWIRVPFHQRKMIEMFDKNELYVFSDIKKNWIKLNILHTPLAGPNFTKLRQSFQNKVRDRLQKAFRLIDAYATVLKDGSFESELLSMSDNEICTKNIKEAATLAKMRLRSSKLTDSDTDILLSLAHLISVGNDGKNDYGATDQWSEPNYYSSVFIDEVQDFTEVQVFLMAEQAEPKRRAVTAVGDFRQQLKYGTVANISRCFPRASGEELKPVFLTENKRQSPALAYFSARFRADILGDRTEGFEFPSCPPTFEFLNFWEIEKEQTEKCIKKIILETPENISMAVICPSKSVATMLELMLHDELGAHYRETQVSEKRDLCRPYFIHFTTALDVKGLEFDSVIVVSFDQFDLSDPLQANTAYVALTRPKKELHVISEKNSNNKQFDKLVTLKFKDRIRHM